MTEVNCINCRYYKTVPDEFIRCLHDNPCTWLKDGDSKRFLHENFEAKKTTEPTKPPSHILP